MSSRQTRLIFQIQPGAPRNEVVSFVDGTWRVKVAAPPVKGRANQELIAFLSEALGISKGSITIVSGHTARRKLLAVDGLTLEEITRRLSP